MFLEELPLRGADRMALAGKVSFWGSSRCTELLERWKITCLSARAPAARGC